MCAPFFTIVTLSYNQKSFLPECIESILSQDFVDFEYIIKDPGSSDGSREIIQAYGDKISLVLFNSDNGPADGLNQSFSHARGRYFLFVNADDCLCPDALSNMHAWIQRDKMKHAVYSGAARIVDAEGHLLRNAYSDQMNLRRLSYGQCILMQPSTVFSAAAFKGVGGFNVENKTNWDGELFVDMALKGYLFTMSSHIYSSYRLHAKSITGSGSMFKQHQQYQARIYAKINSSPYHMRSPLLNMAFWLERRLLNPRDTFERVLKGPVYRIK
jgi:glycosyltransferase involved in cell wall biosynthesis